MSRRRARARRRRSAPFRAPPSRRDALRPTKPWAARLEGGARNGADLRRLARARRRLMGGKAVLKRLGLCGCTLLVGLAARAQDDGQDGIHAPLRLTAGSADELLGQFGPDDRTLYFVSTAEASSSIYAIDVHEGRSRQLFDDGADAKWPRASPDGRTLLYISYRDQPTGQLCIRKLPSTEGRACLALPGAIQAEWIDNSRIVFVDRATLQGNLQLLEVTVGAELTAKVLVPRDATTPPASPDGRWLVYVPIVRQVPQVGRS